MPAGAIAEYAIRDLTEALPRELEARLRAGERPLPGRTSHP